MFVASCSFGKDSIAAIITHLQHGGRVDVALYCRIMFDDMLSAEFPEHEEWIHEIAIPKLEKDWGVPTEVVQAEESYKARFYRVRKSKKNFGKIYGFPMLWGQWCTSDLKRNVIEKAQNNIWGFPFTVGWRCNSRLKIRPLNQAARKQGEVKEIIGIAADEPNRMKRKRKSSNVILPLVEHGIAQEQSFEIARSAGLLSPAYGGGITRLGCWFCHNQSIGELRRLRKNYSGLWDKLLELDKDSPQTFKPDWTVAELDRRFELEDRQMKLF